MSYLVLVESNTTGTGRLFAAATRRLGLRPVVFTRDPARYPYLASDRIDTVHIDTGEVRAVREGCRRLDAPVAGVTSSSEYAIATAADVARSLGLPHPDPDAVRECRDKGAQRRRLCAAGVPGPAHAVATTAAAAGEAAQRLGFPVVVKPAAGSGSVGVARCPDRAAVAAHTASLLDATPAKLGLPRPVTSVVVEEYLPGPEYSVETFDDRVVGVTHKYLGPEPQFLEIGHDFPAPLADPVAAALAETSLAALRALGLGHGPAHVELRHTTAGPRLIEVNPRLAGGMIPRLVQEATGIDLIHQTVAQAAGRAAASPPARERAASVRFLVAEESGRLAEVTGVAEARAVPGVAEVALTRAPGDEVVLRGAFQDRLGYVIAVADARAAAAQAAQAGVHALKARITTGELESGS